MTNKDSENEDTPLFAEIDLSFSDDGEKEENKPLAPNETFSPNTPLVPVICSICGLRMYAQQKSFGLWLECPDCGTLNQIPAPDPQDQKEKPSQVNRYQSESYSHSAQKTPTPRINIDYRAISRVIDPNEPPIPIFGLDNKSDDELENIVDRFFDPDPKRRTSPGEIKYQKLTREKEKKRLTPMAQSPLEKTEEKPVPRPVEGCHPPRKQKQGDGALSRAKSDKTTQKVKDDIPPHCELKKKEIINTQPPHNKKEAFFAPFLDPHQRRRFGMLYLSGVLTILSTTIFVKYLCGFLAPETGMNYHFLLFWGLWLLAFLPLGFWCAHLLLCGISVFDATKKGFDKIQLWIPFRVDFALHYFIRVVFLGWLALVIGVVLALGLKGIGIRFVVGGIDFIQIPVFSSISIFLLLPIFFLALVFEKNPGDFFTKKVWGSLLRLKHYWLKYYLLSALLILLLISCWYGGIRVIETVIHQRFPLFLLFSFATALPLALVTPGTVLLHLRYLGRIAEKIETQQKKKI